MEEGGALPSMPADWRDTAREQIGKVSMQSVGRWGWSCGAEEESSGALPGWQGWGDQQAPTARLAPRCHLLAVPPSNTRTPLTAHRVVPASNKKLRNRQLTWIGVQVVGCQPVSFPRQNNKHTIKRKFTHLDRVSRLLVASQSPSVCLSSAVCTVQRLCASGWKG